VKNLSVLGRVLFALPFGVFGLNHFFMKSFFSGMLTTFIPGGGFTVLFTGALLVAICVLILINKYVREAALALSILLALFILTIHVPHLVSPASINPDFIYREVYKESNINMFIWINLFKDTALLGSSLMLWAQYREK